MLLDDFRQDGSGGNGFERNPAQKQFRVTRNSENSKRGAQGLLGEGGPLTCP